MISSVVKQGAQTCLNKIYFDINKRQLSSLQIGRADSALFYAQKAYYEMIEKQGWKLLHPEGWTYIESHLEACEHTVINAINESQSKKIPFEGYLFATKYISEDMDFDDFHMMANILFKMSWREIVLLSMFNSGWAEDDQKMFITNPAACVEIYDLVTWGLVRPEEGWVIENNSEPVQLKDIAITEFGKVFANAILTEKITDEEKIKVRLSLQLSAMDRKEPVNRSRGLRWRTIKQIDEADVGKIAKDEIEKAKYEESYQAMFEYDMLRGK